MKPYYDRNGITIWLGDCLEVMPKLPNVDVVVTDPPYNLSLASGRSFGKVGNSWGDLMNSAFFYTHVLREIKRLTHIKQGCAWVFNSWRSSPVLAKASHDVPWAIESMLVWDKQWIGPGGSKGLRPSYELVALFVHDNFRLENRSLPDIWQSPVGSHKPTGHPAEKPEPLVRRMLEESGGARVLDPFMGSGTTLVAAKRLGLEAIGIETEEKWCKVAVERLRQEVMV